MALWDNLVAYWKLDETSGTRADSYGSNTLSESASAVGYGTGKVSNAADFVKANSNYLYIYDNAALSMGDIDFTVAAWLKIDDKSTSSGIVSKWYGPINNREYYILYLTGATDRISFFVSNDGTSSASINANNLGSPSTDTWYFIVAWHDSVNDTINIQINNGAIDSLSYASGVYNGSASFVLGSNRVGINTAPLDGMIDEVGVWKRVLSSDERTELYNSGNGTTYTPPAVNSITLSSPSQYQIFQRNVSDEYSATISGTYTGTPTNIEYQIGSEDWATLEASPTGGTFSGIVTLPAGESTIGVRFSNETGVTDTVANVRVGDVYGWIGQSNQDGRLTNGQAYTGTNPASVFDEDGAWENLTTNYQAPSATGYSVLPLLASLIEANQSVPVGFICETQGATTLCPPTSHWSKGGTNYNAFIATITASGINDLKAFLWYQGEQDVANSIARATYSTAERLMLDNLQADTSFSVPLISAMIATLSNFGRDELDAIRLAKSDNWDNDADIYAGPTGHDQTFADNTHWTTDAQATILSQRWWRCIYAAVYSGAESGRGPQFSSASRNNLKVTVTFANGEGVLQNQTNETGFRFTDDGVEIVISGAVASGTSAVGLTLTSLPTGTELISFASGSDSIGATIKDSGTYPLTPEPFVGESVTDATKTYVEKLDLSVILNRTLNFDATMNRTLDFDYEELQDL